MVKPFQISYNQPLAVIVGFPENERLLRLLRIMFFASLTVLGTFLAVPLPYLIIGPLHLPRPEELAAWHSLSLGFYTTSAQILALGVAGTVLGPASAFMSQGLYVLFGVFGLPVLADGGGLLYLQSANFPTLLMFPFAAWLTAKISRKGGFRRRWMAMGSAQLMILGVGAVTGMMSVGPLEIREAWAGVVGPMLQAFPSLLIAVVPLALLGALGDRIRAALPVPQPRPVPKRKSLPAATPQRQTAPLDRQLPGPPKRLSLPESPKRKEIEGPPQRLSLPDHSRDS